jgi:hypothetical protein
MILTRAPQRNGKSSRRAGLSGLRMLSTIAFLPVFVKMVRTDLDSISHPNVPMKTSDLLHFAFRARDPLALGRWYAELFEGQFFVHPVMSALGIVIVKLNHPEAVFNGLVEFWPWDLEWDGQAAVFRKIEPRPSPTSYGHAAVKVTAEAGTICKELERRGIVYRMEPRATGFLIPVVNDPEGNMIELFPNIDHMSLPEKALCPPEHIDAALAQVRAGFAELTKNLGPADGVPLLLFETHMQSQQQQQQ